MTAAGLKGFLKSSFDTALAWPIAHAGFRGMTFAAAFASSSDFHPLTHSGIAPFVTAFGDVRRLIKICDVIDDQVDNADPEIAAAADFSRDQDGVSRFLHDTRFVPAQYISVLRNLHDKGVVDFDVAIGYSNAFCDFVKHRAGMQANFAASGYTLEERKEMMEENINFAGLFGSFFFGLVQPPSSPLNEGVSHESVSRAYPEVYQINRLGQMLDDLRDLLIDIHDEMKTGHVSPNAIMASARGIQDSHEILRFMETRKNSRSVAVTALPNSLQEGVRDIQDRFFSDVSSIHSRTARNILESFWRNTVREEIATLNHPRVLKKLAAEAAMSQSFDCGP